MLINLSIYINDTVFKRFHFDTDEISEIRMNRALQHLNLINELTADNLELEIPIKKDYIPTAEQCWTYKHKKSLTVSEVNYDETKGKFIRGKIIGKPQLF